MNIYTYMDYDWWERDMNSEDFNTDKQREKRSLSLSNLHFLCIPVLPFLETEEHREKTLVLDFAWLTWSRCWMIVRSNMWTAVQVSLSCLATVKALLEHSRGVDLAKDCTHLPKC